MKCSALFSDGMVLQRGVENPVWGYTLPGQPVSVEFGDAAYTAQADAEGYFEILLPPMEAGGSYEMAIRADEYKIIQDIMVGDVYILGGQSNMELPLARCLERYREELDQMQNPKIRMFAMERAYDFLSKREEVWEGCWNLAQGEALLAFSAVGYFSAQEIQKEKGIAIGLLQTAVGGSPAKAWCSEETIRRMGYYAAELDQCRQTGYVEQVMEQEAEAERIWLDEAAKGWRQEAGTGTVAAAGTHTIRVPGLWTGTKLEGFSGSMWLWKEVQLTEEEAKRPCAELVLGAIQDADDVWINGIHIGNTGYCYPPRYYQVPEGILHRGTNRIEIGLKVFNGAGGFMPGKDYGIRFSYRNQGWINLEGEWNYQIRKEMKPMPSKTFFEYMPVGGYQAMLYPLRRWKASCVLFYQGESNTGEPERYGEELKALIQDWRKLWRNQELPFLYVQLAGYSAGWENSTGTSWAVLREEQRKTQEVPGTAMIPAFDLGDYNELHPTDKKSVGRRMARGIRALVYGEEVNYQGPGMHSVRVRPSGYVVTFSHGEGLHTRDGAAVGGFVLVDGNGTGFSAEARINPENPMQVCLDRCEGVEAVQIRYAWKDCPTDANLYGADGLPLEPFCFKVTGQT